MADTPDPTPPPVVTGAPLQSAVVEPAKGKPVVLATPIGEEFVLPDMPGDDKQPLRITSAGVALSEADAKQVRDTARMSYQHVITVTEKG